MALGQADEVNYLVLLFTLFFLLLVFCCSLNEDNLLSPVFIYLSSLWSEKTISLCGQQKK